MYDALLVVTAVDSKPSAASLYGPGSIIWMVGGTTAADTGYAPVSITIVTSSPSRSPSSLTAARTSKLSSRACPEAARCSLRSSTHLTGRPRARAAAATASSSRDALIFKPNEPPMSPASTCTCSGSMPRHAAIPALVRCTLWVAAYTVSLPDSASGLTTMPRPSMGTFWWRCTSK